jgi:diguanylate cyclase
MKKKGSPKRASLGHVLDQTKKIKEDVEQSASELMSVNDVLKQGTKAIIPIETMQDAITHNEDVEHQVAQAADDLNQVNTELTREVAEREEVEAQLADTQASLAEVRDDLSKSQAKEEETRKFALQDPLTCLPNRVLFEQILEQGIIQAKRRDRRLAVLFIDIDDFKRFNDQYGHDLGDKVLIMVANRLKASVRQEDTVSRWGGDEFVCLLLEVKKAADVTRLVELMMKQIAKPWMTNGAVHSIKASIGVALYTTDGKTGNILLKKADTAMYIAKRTMKRVALVRESTMD